MKKGKVEPLMHSTPSHGKKDRHASADYHAKNKEHGMPLGHCPADDAHEGYEGEGGKGMAGNCSYGE